MNKTTRGKKKHIPYRMCAVCREKKPKTDLIKLIKLKEGKISLPRQESLQGKGIYLCPTAGCISSFIYHRRFRKSYCSLLTKESLNFLTQFLEKIEGNEPVQQPSAIPGPKRKEG